MGRNNRAPAAAEADQIGFQKITRRFWSDPSRKASHEARRDACGSYIDAAFLWFFVFGCLPAAGQRPLTASHCSHAGAQAGKKYNSCANLIPSRSPQQQS